MVQDGRLNCASYGLNTASCVMGVALGGVGAFLYYVTHKMGAALNNELDPIMLVVAALGGVLFIISILGICGACHRKSMLLSGFIAAMILILIAQFAAVVILFTFESSVHYYLGDGMGHSMLFYGKEGDQQKFTDSMDFIQETLKCCGKYGYMEYNTKNASNWLSTKSGSVPDSCCEAKTTDCGKDRIANSNNASLYTRGCYEETKVFLELYLTVIGGAALLFMFVQLLAVFVNISLHRRCKEHEDYQLQSKKVKEVKDKSDLKVTA